MRDRIVLVDQSPPKVLEACCAQLGVAHSVSPDLKRTQLAASPPLLIFDDNDIFGDGVNIAARLEGIAQPGGTPPRGGSPCALLALHLHQVGQKTFTSKLLSMPSTQRTRSRGRALRQAARSTRPVLTMRSGNLTQDRSNCITDKTRSPGAWAYDRRQDDWAITPKIQQATSAPPKIRMTKPVRSDRRRPSDAGHLDERLETVSAGQG